MQPDGRVECYARSQQVEQVNARSLRNQHEVMIRAKKLGEGQITIQQEVWSAWEALNTGGMWGNYESSKYFKGINFNQGRVF